MSIVEQDGLSFFDEEDGGTIIFNFYSWAEGLRAGLVKYGHINEQEAQKLLHESGIYRYASEIKTAMGAVCISHEIDYHWIMIILHGECYWVHKNISSDIPESYFQWDEAYRKQNHLADSFEFVSDK